ncbi:sensor histidine kinase [Microbacterium flavescens]|uniref:sensor histidine kinase n=1 Tax=Microbacterium flavescens TaxID=69366 RepID=UPI001BDE4F76|nr:HAMP domain-containing sensor histidine kinase [Microbacterium flavescens]
MGAWETTGPVRLSSPALDLAEADARVRSIWIWQLALCAVTGIVVVVVAVLDPSVLAIVPVAIGMTGIFLTTVVALIVPWRRLPEAVPSALPYLDIVWVGLLTFSTELRLSHLWVFPIAWLATQFGLLRLAGGLAVVAIVTLVEVLVNDMSRASALRVLIALLALAFIGVTVNNAARQAGAYRTLLRRQARRSTTSLDQVSIEKRRVSDTLDGVSIGIARVSPDGELLSANAAYRELYALDVADPAQPAHSVEYDSLRGSAVRTRDRTFARAARGETLDEEKVWLYDPEGRWHALAVTTRSQAAQGEEEPSTVLIVRDLTDVLQAQRRRDALAAVVSHELRNPLTAILGQVDRLLERDDLDADAQRRIRIIEESGERMRQLVSAILTAPLEQVADPGRDAWAVTDLRKILDASVDSFETLAAERDITLEIAPGDPLEVWADAFRLRQLVDNLLSNAVKYSPAGGRVTVTARTVDADAEFVVADGGIGILPADLPHIYDDFFRSRAAVDSGIPGTGLGMRIVRHIVDQHGGSIQVESAPGVGTTVTTRIPREAG